MFQITRFVMEDFIDSLDQIIYIVSLNKRYMVYNPLVDVSCIQRFIAWARAKRHLI